MDETTKENLIIAGIAFAIAFITLQYIKPHFSLEEQVRKWVKK